MPVVDHPEAFALDVLVVVELFLVEEEERVVYARFGLKYAVHGAWL